MAAAVEGGDGAGCCAPAAAVPAASGECTPPPWVMEGVELLVMLSIEFEPFSRLS